MHVALLYMPFPYSYTYVYIIVGSFSLGACGMWHTAGLPLVYIARPLFHFPCVIGSKGKEGPFPARPYFCWVCVCVQDQV